MIEKKVKKKTKVIFLTSLIVSQRFKEHEDKGFLTRPHYV